MDRKMNYCLSLIDEYNELKIIDSVNYQKFNEYLFTFHSTSIEGSTLSLNDTELLLGEGVVPKNKPLEHINMVKDHENALSFVLSSKEKLISIEYIQEINAKVMKSSELTYHTPFGTIYANKGALRRGAVLAGSHYFPNHEKVPMLLKSFVDELNAIRKEKLSVKDAILVSFEAHYNLVSIHPFYDGNGRTSRLIMFQLQNEYQLPVSCPNVSDKSEYITALQETRAAKDLTIFNQFMLKSYTSFIETEINNFKKQYNPQINRGKYFSLLF